MCLAPLWVSKEAIVAGVERPRGKILLVDEVGAVMGSYRTGLCRPR